jgi:uncharacterized protein (DUF488 family)
MNHCILLPAEAHTPTTSPRYLYTLGYHEAGAVALVETLVALDVTLVDIGLYALSERGCWQGWWLAERFGRSYWHVPDLGNLGSHQPGEPMRLANPERGLPLLLARLADGEALALLCGCPRLERCHRKLVADLIQERLPRVQVIHLPVTRR